MSTSQYADSVLSVEDEREIVHGGPSVGLRALISQIERELKTTKWSLDA